MKFKHLLILAVAFVLVAFGTSCSKPSENKIIGKWQIASMQYRDSDDPEWEYELPEADEIVTAEFRSDNFCAIYFNGELEDLVAWSYDKSSGKIIFDYDIFEVTKCTSKEMIWYYKESDEDEWEEMQINWKKVK